jgi:hypothetical protein
MTKDRSFYGAIGMSGGVKEWATPADGASGPSVMGFYSRLYVSDPSTAKAQFDLRQGDFSRTIERKNSGTANENIGFRCALSLNRL